MISIINKIRSGTRPSHFAHLTRYLLTAPGYEVDDSILVLVRTNNPHLKVLNITTCIFLIGLHIATTDTGFAEIVTTY